MSNKVNIDSLIEKYAVENQQITYICPDGEELVFKTFARKSDLDEFLETVARWYADVKNATEAHPLHGLVPETAQEAIDAYMIHHLSVSPAFSLPDALRMLKAPWLLRDIIDALGKACKTMESIYIANTVKEAKKNLKTPPCEDTPSSPPSAPSDDTPTT